MVGVLNTLIAIAFALASAITVAWGTVVRHRIARDAPGHVMATAIRRPLWWVGTFAALAAYGLQVIALGFGTLLVVQPILVLSLMFTLPLAAWYARRPMPFHEVFWSLALTIAVGVLVVYGRPTAGDPLPAWSQWWPALLFGVVLMSALGAVAWRCPQHRALALGTTCGVLYGYVALLSKAVMDTYLHLGLGELLSSWTLYTLIGLAGLGTIVQQYSFQAGPLSSSLPAMTIFEPIVAFGLGYVVLGEHFQVETAAGWALMAGALALMVTSTIVLSRMPVK